VPLSLFPFVASHPILSTVSTRAFAQGWSECRWCQRNVSLYRELDKTEWGEVPYYRRTAWAAVVCWVGERDLFQNLNERLKAGRWIGSGIANLQKPTAKSGTGGRNSLTALCWNRSPASEIPSLLILRRQRVDPWWRPPSLRQESVVRLKSDRVVGDIGRWPTETPC